MPRFFIEKCLPSDVTNIRLEQDDAHHISHVLRMREGEEVIVCDGAKSDHITVIESFEVGAVILKVVDVKKNNTEPLWRASLYQGLPKGDKMDLIIQKAVELGVSRIVPVECSRSISKLPVNKQAKKLERWNRIALEAARQCGRGQIPQIMPPVSYKQAVQEAAAADLSFLPWENERSVSLRALISSRYPTLELEELTVAFLIGPEGGLSLKEVGLAEQAGIRSVTLGPRILRTETAGLAVLAMLGYQYDQNDQ